MPQPNLNDLELVTCTLYCGYLALDRNVYCARIQPKNCVNLWNENDKNEVDDLAEQDLAFNVIEQEPAK